MLSTGMIERIQIMKKISKFESLIGDNEEECAGLTEAASIASDETAKLEASLQALIYKERKELRERLRSINAAKGTLELQVKCVDIFI